MVKIVHYWWCEGKKVGGEREKGDQIKNFYNVNRSKHRASDRLQKKSQISRDFQRQIHGKNGQFRGKIRDKFRWETIIKKANFAKNFLGKFRWKAIGFALISWTFLMKQNRNFANFFFFFWGGWGGGNDEQISMQWQQQQKHQLLIKLMLPFQNRRFWA